jgi:hypothetical protein
LNPAQEKAGRKESIHALPIGLSQIRKAPPAGSAFSLFTLSDM